MFIVDGLYWPDGATGNRPERYLKHAADSEAAIRLCPKPRRVVVQAGGFNGLWARHLAKRFRKVITFEAEPENFECLIRNCRKKRTVEARHALLGERAGVGTINVSGKNPGGHRATFGEGDLPVVAIDDLGLEGVGLIALDVEGSELPALMGAVRTISRCRPVIMLEVRGHGERFGYSDADLASWLTRAGYHKHGKVSRDQIWVHG